MRRSIGPIGPPLLLNGSSYPSIDDRRPLVEGDDLERGEKLVQRLVVFLRLSTLACAVTQLGHADDRNPDVVRGKSEQ
jgi:hypothetical protein